MTRASVASRMAYSSVVCQHLHLEQGMLVSKSIKPPLVQP